MLIGRLVKFVLSMYGASSGGAGSYQSSLKSTSPPKATADALIVFVYSLPQALYNKNNSCNNNESSNSSKLFQAPTWTNTSDSYFKRGRSAHAIGSPGSPESPSTGLGRHPLQQPSTLEMNEDLMHLLMHHHQLPTLGQPS